METTIDTEFLTEFLVGILNIPSPTGDTDNALAYTARALKTLGIHTHRTIKGTLLATVDGISTNSPRAVTAHVDTLGAVVKEIKPTGRLGLSLIGNYPWNAIESESVTIATENAGTFRGSVQLNYASKHVHGPVVGTTIRDAATMEVRLDARTTNRSETAALGISVGDFVYLDPRVEMVNGFIRSRHLDNKAGVACLMAAMKLITDQGLKLKQRSTLHFSHYEEVGHGAASGIPADCTELLTVDMAAVGDGQNSDEFHCTLCIKDSAGPYHRDFNRKLRILASENGIDLRTDVYPFYGSDGESHWRAGGNSRVALIGPGVDASHSYERTHMDALIATSQLIAAYLTSE